MNEARASARRIWGLIYRHVTLYRRSWPRLLELTYWPTLQMLIWGLTASFVSQRMGGSNLGSLGVTAIGLLLGGVLLWEVTLRSQIGMAFSFLEEIWSRNLGHVFVSPLRPWELLAALVCMSMLRVALGMLPAILLAWLLYAFDLFSLGAPLVLFVANLMVMGWWVSLGVISLLLRHGAGAEALAWSVMFAVTPFSAVFYPVAILPPAMRVVAFALPSSHIFEGMRAVLAEGFVPWDQMALAAGLNAAWLAAALVLFAGQFRAARERGALLTIGE